MQFASCVLCNKLKTNFEVTFLHPVHHHIIRSIRLEICYNFCLSITFLLLDLNWLCQASGSLLSLSQIAPESWSVSTKSDCTTFACTGDAFHRFDSIVNHHNNFYCLLLESDGLVATSGSVGPAQPEAMPAMHHLDRQRRCLSRSRLWRMVLGSHRRRRQVQLRTQIENKASNMKKKTSEKGWSWAEFRRQNV